MPNASNALLEISKLNGNFKRNCGKLIGGFLYLRSISAPPAAGPFCGAGLCSRWPQLV
jgi:hypothetical protein